MKTITSISFKEWLQLWQVLGLTILETYHSERGLTSYEIETPTAVIKWKVDSSD